jgi:lysozyme family protein
MVLTLEQTRKGYQNLWNLMTVLPAKRTALKEVVAAIARGRDRYEEVERRTGVPWWFIGILHMRESSCDMSTYLGNGQTLARKTTIEPAGRGPFSNFEDGAVDALGHQGYLHITDWSVSAVLYRFEAFNGWGYFLHGVNSAYVWAWTNLYTGGKYVGEHKWSATAKDPQPGCAAILRGLVDAGYVTLLSDGGAPEESAADPIILDVGSRGDEVRDLQTRLRDKGFAPGDIDGSYGQKTADAVAAFQRRNNLQGKAGAWHKSYDDELAATGSIVPENRAKATPAELEAKGDSLSRLLRLARDFIAWITAIFAAAAGSGSLAPQSLLEAPHGSAPVIGAITAFAKSNAWVILLLVCVAFVVVLEVLRQWRASEYRSGDFQGPVAKEAE